MLSFDSNKQVSGVFTFLHNDSVLDSRYRYFDLSHSQARVHYYGNKSHLTSILCPTFFHLPPHIA